MTRLSNRQYPMLAQFYRDAQEGDPPFFMSIEEAQHYDQRPFRSMLIQEWIAYHPRKGFAITKKGRAAWREFQGTDIHRKDPTLPLTAYFDATAYGLRKPKIHEIPKRGAA